MFYQRKRILATEALCCLSFSGHIIQPNHGCCVQRWCLFNYFGADGQPGLDATNFVVLWITWRSFVEVVFKKNNNNSTSLWSQILFHWLGRLRHVVGQRPQPSSCCSICPAAVNLALIKAIFCAAPPSSQSVTCQGQPEKFGAITTHSPAYLSSWQRTVNVVSEQKEKREEPDPCWQSKLNDSIPQTRRWPQLPRTV